jgi:hypothetical protein
MKTDSRKNSAQPEQPRPLSPIEEFWEEKARRRMEFLRLDAEEAQAQLPQLKRSDRIIRDWSFLDDLEELDLES